MRVKWPFHCCICLFSVCVFNSLNKGWGIKRHLCDKFGATLSQSGRAILFSSPLWVITKSASSGLIAEIALLLKCETWSRRNTMWCLAARLSSRCWQFEKAPFWLGVPNKFTVGRTRRPRRDVICMESLYRWCLQLSRRLGLNTKTSSGFFWVSWLEESQYWCDTEMQVVKLLIQ